MLAVHKYLSLLKLIEQIAEYKNFTNSTQIKSIEKYLKELDTQSYVIEENYTDAGYLVDYSNYYSRCHTEYKRLATRIHFFSGQKNDIDDFISKIIQNLSDHTDPSEKFIDNTNSLNKLYLGFLVIKPLPETLIGRTCLAVYPKRDTKKHRLRHYPILRDYGVSLYGIRLSVESIAFQQQDRETAACATAAVWFALHGSPRNITTEAIPSPYEITNKSNNIYSKKSLGDISRRFPTSGLTLEQIEFYLRSHEFDCIVCGINPEESTDKLKDYLATYVKGGHPMIVVGRVYATNDISQGYSFIGNHAVTALGYGEQEKNISGAEYSKIEKLYAHDDNIGPFASYHFTDVNSDGFLKILENQNSELITWERKIKGYLANESGLRNGNQFYRIFVPCYFLIPINHKIRLPSEPLSAFVKHLVTYFKKTKMDISENDCALDLSWRLELEQYDATKSHFLKSSKIPYDKKTLLLVERMPKYIWRLQFFSIADNNRSEAIDILFDATDISQSVGVLALVAYDQPHTKTIQMQFLRWIKSRCERPSKEVEESITPVFKSIYKKLALDRAIQT